MNSTSMAEGDALLSEVEGALSTLRRLLAHPSLAEAPERKSIASGAERVSTRLSRTELSVVVAGSRGAGKTTFFDALFGDRRLGQARGRTRITTFVRRGAVWDFEVRLGPAEVERFTELFPDRSAELEQEIAEARSARDEARRELDRARDVVKRAEQTAATAEGVGRNAFTELEAARERATAVSRELRDAERDEQRAETALVAVERAIPAALRARAPWWAVWWWVFHLIFSLFRRRRWEHYLAAREQRARSRERALELRARATDTATVATELESRLATSGGEAGTARGGASDARRKLSEAQAALDQAEDAIETHENELDTWWRARSERFFAELRARSEAPSPRIREITIIGPARFLPEDVVLIDAPALSEGATEERARAWLTLADRADGCILLAELDRAVTESTKRFLQEMVEVVPHVLLVLTKIDQAYVEAVGRGGSDPWQQVEQARRIGTRRFAREVGRAPDTVLSIAVAAQAALDDPTSGLARRFETEIDKLFELLRQERALILGTRAAGAVRECIAAANEIEHRADRAYADRIAALEANRLPEPDEFRRQELARAEPEIESATEAAISAALDEVTERMALLRAQGEQHLSRAASAAEVQRSAESAERDLESGFARLRGAAALALESAIDRSVRSLEAKSFARLRERYGLIHDVRRSQSSLPRLEPVESGLVAERAAIVSVVERSLRSLRRLRFSVCGAAAFAGAMLGTLLAPGIGTALGACLGGLLWFVPVAGVLRERALRAIDGALSRELAAIGAELGARRQETRAAIRAALDRSLERAILRFARWIAEPLEAEQQTIDRERTLRAELGALCRELEAHDERLGELAKAATEASIGLCR